MGDVRMKLKLDYDVLDRISVLSAELRDLINDLDLSEETIELVSVPILNRLEKLLGELKWK
jgi:hypothetical protein